MDFLTLEDAFSHFVEKVYPNLDPVQKSKYRVNVSRFRVKKKGDKVSDGLMRRILEENGYNFKTLISKKNQKTIKKTR